MRKLWDADKAMLTWKFIAIMSILIRSQISRSAFHIKTLEKRN